MLPYTVVASMDSHALAAYVAALKDGLQVAQSRLDAARIADAHAAEMRRRLREARAARQRDMATRDQAIFALARRGLSDEEIGAAVGVHPRTVQRALKRLVAAAR
jgi:DNA-binding NarL/FixJ family response regulator